MARGCQGGLDNCVDEPLARHRRQGVGFTAARVKSRARSSRLCRISYGLPQAIWALGHVARGDEGSKSSPSELARRISTSLVKYLHGRSAGMRDQAGFALRQLCSGDEEVDPEADESPLIW